MTTHPTRINRTARWMAALSVVALALAPAIAEAQAGRRGSVGSRGDRTYQAPPPSNTAPRGAAPVERSMTPAPQPGAAAAARPGAAAAAAPARGGFMGGLAGGLLAGGLIGMMLGGGLFGAGFAGFLGAMLQFALIGLLVFFVIRLFRRRAQPAGMARDMQPPASPLRGYGGGTPQPAAATPPVQLTGEDFDAFESLLTKVQDAWSRQDRDLMARVATPEMVTILGEQIGELRAKGLANRVRDVKLEQGDLAEAWEERGRNFATVAMRFSMVAETTDASGHVVEGGPQRQTTTELWTFVRIGAGDWMLSAIQQAA